MKTSGATDASVRRWLAEEHELEVSRATFSGFKKKYNLTDNNIHQDNIDLAIDTILQQQAQTLKLVWKT